MNLQEMIQRKLSLMEEKAEHEKVIKGIKEMINEQDQKILDAFEELGIDQARTGNTTVFKNEADVPNVEDWDAFYKYILDHKAMHLLERRPAVLAWREMYETGETIPGTVPFEKISLGKRTG